MIHPIFRLQLKYCSNVLCNVLHSAQFFATKIDTMFFTPEHLLFCMIMWKDFHEFLHKQKIDVYQWGSELCDYINKMDERKESMDNLGVLLSIQLEELLDQLVDMQNQSVENDGRTVHPIIDIPDVVMAMAQLEDSLAAITISRYLGDTPEALKMCLQEYESGDGDDDDDDVMLDEFKQKMHSVLDAIGQLSHIAVQPQEDTDTMQSAGRKAEPWMQLVSTGSMYCSPAVGREDEINRAQRIINRCHRNNVVLVGERGVGKSCVMNTIACNLAYSDIKESFNRYKVYSMNMAHVMSGINSPGEFDRRIRMVMEGLNASGSSILCIDNLISICDSNGTLRCALDIMEAYLDRGTKIIGTATYKEYNKMLTDNPNFARNFHMVEIKEESAEVVLQQIAADITEYEVSHGCTYQQDAVEYAVRQSVEVMRDRFLPEKALDILDGAGSYRQMHPRLNNKGERMQWRYQFVTREIVQTVIADMCRVDAKILKDVGNESLKDLQGNITNLIYGQDEAVQQVVRSVMMAKAGLTDPGKPMASLLFVGPTGVGKTELCRVLAEQLGVELVRFDMSEYMEKHAVSKLIGSPAGYVGYDEGGLLTGAVRRSPNCVLLLDEIEKAHSDIYNVLLQVMDYARLTDNKGGKVDFSHVILVMTSNAGAQHADRSSIGFAGGQSRGQAMLTEVKKTFKPEFLNRLSGTVVFRDMDRHMACLILDKKVRELAQRLQSRGVKLQLMPDAQEFMLQEGFSAQYGAREMDRAIQQHLMPMLTEAVLFGSLCQGGTASICMHDGVLSLSVSADNSTSSKSKKKKK